MTQTQHTPRALIFGAIGTLAETSEMQRDAFNAAFKEAGLDWQWDVPTYRALLERPGGTNRIAEEAAKRGETVDAAALHTRKSELFQDRLSAGIPLRAGVSDMLAKGRSLDLPVALATTTSRANVESILAATGLKAAAFAFIGDVSLVAAPKPDTAIYLAAVSALGCAPQDAICIEDTPDAAASAARIGLRVFYMPGAMHGHRPTPEGVTRVEDLSGVL